MVLMVYRFGKDRVKPVPDTTQPYQPYENYKTIAELFPSMYCPNNPFTAGFRECIPFLYARLVHSWPNIKGKLKANPQHALNQRSIITHLKQNYESEKARLAPPTNFRCSDECNCGMIASGVPQTTTLFESINKVHNALQDVVTASHNTSTETQEGLLSLESRMRDELPTLVFDTITKQFQINGQRIIGDTLFAELTKTITSGFTNGFAQLNDSLVTQESVGGRNPDNSLEDQSMREE